MFQPSVYAARRAALRAGLARRGVESGLVVVIGHGESPRTYRDSAYAFRQDSSFLYFAGLDLPDLALSIDLATGAETLYGDDVSMDDIVWTGALPLVGELAAQAGIARAEPRGSLAKAAAAAGGKLLHLPTYRAETRAELAELAGIPLAAVDAGASVPLIRAAIELREVKEAAEVEELEAAVALSVAMHREALGTTRAGMLESQVAARITAVALSAGGCPSFLPIATTRGAILHNRLQRRSLAEGGLFLLDAGAETASCYCGDLTTTFPISGRFDGRQREIYEIVLAMGAAASPLVRPGRPFLEVHLAAARAGIEGLKALGLMRGSVDGALAAGAEALFFPHGVGHQIGLDVHDMESYGESWVGYDGAPRDGRFGRKSLRLAKPLKAGMVHTIEPGLYFIPELIAKWKAERRFEEFVDYAALAPYMAVGGIRNEENWLVTAGGGRRLGPDFDKGVAAVEALRAGAVRA